MFGAARYIVASAALDGASHTGLYADSDDGRAVFIKLEEDPGRLATEAVALTWAAAHAISVPTPLGYGLASVDGSARVVLITERITHGTRPIDSAGWSQMGVALARVADVPIGGCPLKRISNSEFADQHLRMLDEVRRLLSDRLRGDLERAIERTRSPAFAPVLTHGDPGGGNFLCTAAGGVLLDWESAAIVPFGLDFGRAYFIALLDIQGTGRGRSLARAVGFSYLSAAGSHVLSGDDQFTWSTVAGLQFIFRRWSRKGQARIRNYADAISALKQLSQV